MNDEFLRMQKEVDVAYFKEHHHLHLPGRTVETKKPYQDGRS